MRPRAHQVDNQGERISKVPAEDNGGDERMDQPATPPPGANEEFPTPVYVTQMLRRFEMEIGVLREKVNDIPKTVRETTRADIAELETRLTKSMGDSETRLTKAIGDSKTQLTKAIGDSETRLTKSIGDSQTQMIKWMIGIGLAGAGLVITALRLLVLTPPS